MSSWNFSYDNFNPENEALREALCTLGNGYFATRGAAEESPADACHYPGTYLAGGYNRLVSAVNGRDIENEDLVNFPNWLPLTFRIGKEGWFHLSKVKILKFNQDLDLKMGILTRNIQFEDKKGRKTKLITRRFVHMRKPHLAGIEWVLKPLNWSGEITIRSSLDGNVINGGVPRYKNLKSRHLEVLNTASINQDSVEISAQTNQSNVKMAQACRTKVFKKASRIPSRNRTIKEKNFIGKTLTFPVKQGNSYRIEKIVSIYTSRDRGITEPVLNARLTVENSPNFNELLNSHVREWKYLWKKFDIGFEGHPEEELILRLHTFHLLQTVSPNTIGLDVGVPARGLHGEAYRGHIFWDELFIFPIYNFRYPEITRSLLLYRYRRLERARSLAKEKGYLGARFPWQSGSDGREETQIVHLNPRSGRWVPDKSQLQRHVNIAIAYNLWQYYSITGDHFFLENYGAEMYLEIAKFWSSITTYNAKRGRFEINGVMGPDEYHEELPGAKKPGLKNNAYTNIMAVWTLKRAFNILEDLSPSAKQKFIEELEITEKELQRWRNIIHKMFIPLHEKDIISQFEGYETLQEFDWEGYKQKYGTIERLDRILEAEQDNTDNYKVSKQPDVCMLFYLLPYHVLKEIFKDLGYSLTKSMIRRNISYYLSRTSHGSTLSKIVNASILSRIDRKQGWDFFHMALLSDVEDVQGGTTPEGIHLGAMAGTVDIAIRDFSGIETRGNSLFFDPQLPTTLKALKFQIKFRKNWLKLNIRQKSFNISVEKDGEGAVPISVRGKKSLIRPGRSKTFKL